MVYHFSAAADVQCVQCRYAVTDNAIFNIGLNTNPGDLDINCTDQAGTVNTVTCNHTCAEAVFHGIVDTSSREYLPAVINNVLGAKNNNINASTIRHTASDATTDVESRHCTHQRDM